MAKDNSKDTNTQAKKEQRQMNPIVFAYNLFQIASWGFVLVYLFYSMVVLPKDQFRSLYHDNANFRLLFQVAQTSQILDLVFSVLRMTTNSPVTVFSQLGSRLFVVWIILPYVPAPQAGTWSDWYALHYMICAWSQAEIIRFMFYSFKSLQDGIIGHLRYNMFLVMYPTGVASEFLNVRDASAVVDQMLPADRPFNMLMPNSVNFEFRYGWWFWLMVVVYAAGFPVLYSYMLTQRQRFNAKLADQGKTTTAKKTKTR